MTVNRPNRWPVISMKAGIAASPSGCLSSGGRAFARPAVALNIAYGECPDMRSDRRIVLIAMFIAIVTALVLFVFNTGPVPAP